VSHLFFCIFYIFFNAFAFSQSDIKIPLLNSPVVDEANFFSSSEKQDLSHLIRHIRNNNGPQIAILTLENLQGYEIEEFSIKVAEKWQLGSKEKDDGLLIVISKQERAIRIEVGNGIEGEVTDYRSSYYAKEILPSYFKKNQYYEGLQAVLYDVDSLFSQSLNQDAEKVLRKKKSAFSDSRGSSWIEFIFVLVAAVLVFASALFPSRPLLRGIFSGFFITLIFLPAFLGILWYVGVFILSMLAGFINLGSVLSMMLSHRSRGGSSGGGFGGFGGGGGWSGGGGGFSGGGSSGRW
jgi:uncharacterized protein